MAEILVEPDNRDPNKNKPSIWPWILGALLLIGLVWVLVGSDDDDEVEQVATTTAVEREPASNNTYAETAAAGPVAEFIRFANDEERYERENVANTDNTTTTEGEMGLNHNYTSEGIQKLSAALNALADNAAGDSNVEQKRQMFKQNADKIQQDAQSLDHANTIRATFVSAADLMASIKQSSYPDSDVDAEELKKAAEEIDPKTPTLEQKDKVKGFFDKAGDAVEKMAEESNAAVTNDM